MCVDMCVDLQSLDRPRHEPVNCAARDERRELPCTRRELVADGRETQNYVEVVARAVEEKLVEVVPRVDEMRQGLLCDWPDVIDDHVELVLREEVCDLASREDLVYVLKEAFLFHFSVSEHEANLPKCRIGEQAGSGVMNDAMGRRGHGPDGR